MTEQTADRRGWQHGRSRRVMWTVAILATAAPILARGYVDGMHWSMGDFLAFGTMIAAACCAVELAMRASTDRSYRAAMLMAIATSFLLLWTNLAVGIVGDEHDPANLMFHSVLAIGAVGAAVSRLRPRGMALTTIAMSLAFIVALVASTAVSAFSVSVRTVAACATMIGVWLLCAALFHAAARRLPRIG